MVPPFPFPERFAEAVRRAPFSGLSGPGPR